MQRILKTMSGVTAFALLSGIAFVGTVRYAGAQDKEKKVKDQVEFDLSDAAAKDLLTKDFNKAIKDLDAWAQHNPDSDFKDDRLYDYLQAYTYATPPQPAKALDIGSKLLDMDLTATFKGQPNVPILVAFLTTSSASALAQAGTATPEQLAIGDKAAHKLLDLAPVYFVPANKPASATDADFAQLRKQFEDLANGYMFLEAVTPGNAALAKKDCPGAEAGYAKALGAYPERPEIARALANAYLCEKKIPQAIYEYARAAALDTSGSADAKKLSDYAKNTLYSKYHGSDEGYAQLQAMAKSNPLPPPDLKIKTASEIDTAAQEAKLEDLKKNHPELLLWMNLKTSLSDPAYFEASGMKGSLVQNLKGKVLESKCRAKELLVVMPSETPGTGGAEVTLKLDAPLSGKLEPRDISFEGVPSAFTASPFMLTMDVDKAKLTELNPDLKTTPCAGAASPARKGTAKKKK